MKTKIFCDIADYKTIKFFNNKSLVDGFTTNPSLMRLAGAKNYKNYSLKILKICKKKPISFEVFGDDYKSMKDQALKINKWGKNVYVKIPVVNSKGFYTGKIIKELNQKKIKLNITAVYTAKQTKQILNSINKKTNLIISIFAGRAADTGKDPIPEFKKSILLAKKFSNVEILWASVREPYNYLQSKAHIQPRLKSLLRLISIYFLQDSRKNVFYLHQQVQSSFTSTNGSTLLESCQSPFLLNLRVVISLTNMPSRFLYVINSCFTTPETSASNAPTNGPSN